MATETESKTIDRRGALKCMAWAGAGVIWTLDGGVPSSSILPGGGAAQAAEKAQKGFSFLQISDSHIGFNKPANPNPLGTLQKAIDKVNALPEKPAFLIHTGDITHLSKPEQFDDAEKVIGAAKLDVHYVPGEHDVVDENDGKAYLDRFGKGAQGRRVVLLRRGRRAFRRPGQCREPQKRRARLARRRAIGLARG